MRPTTDQVRSVVGAAALGTLAAATTLVHARSRAPYRPRLERLSIPMPRGKIGLTGLRIGFFTDPHFGPLMTPGDVEPALSVLFSEDPHLLLLGGDLICDSPRHAPGAATLLGEYGALAPLGALAVLGNHDISNDAHRLSRLLERADIRVLRNDAVSVPYGAEQFWIVGIDDALLGRPDPDLAFSNVPPGAAPLVLWHEPDWAEETANRGGFLQLSGHSHGGQVRLPLVGAVATPSGGRRFVTGLNWINGMPIYTSRGVGIYRPPVRFRCPPEVTLITLA